MGLPGQFSVTFNNKTYALYLDAEGKPVAGVTWAYLNRANTDFYLINGVLPDVSAWRSGPDLWLLTMIAEGGNIRSVFKDMLDNVFKDAKEAFMLRPSPGGERRIVRVTHTGTEIIRTLPGPTPQ